MFVKITNASSNSLLPCCNVGTDWVTEAFESNFAEVFEAESFANAQFGNRVRNQDLFRLRVTAEPRG